LHRAGPFINIDTLSHYVNVRRNGTCVYRKRPLHFVNFPAL